MSHHTPYENLDPNLILDAIESVGFRCTGSLFSLNSYENRVYEIHVEDYEPLIAKYYRPGRWTGQAIAEEHAFLETLEQVEVPVNLPFELNHQRRINYAKAVFQ